MCRHIERAKGRAGDSQRARERRYTCLMMQRRLSSRTLRAAALFLVAIPAAACANSSDDETLPPVVLGMLETTAPTYDDGQQQIYQVNKEVRLPFRRPNDGERAKGEQDPYPSIPFHVTTNSRITVRYTISNLDDAKHTVELLVDPWNEFVRYVPGTSPGREPGAVIPNFSGVDKFFVLPPKSRIEGILTPDDMIELATDLTTAMELQKRPPDAAGEFGGAALYNRAFNIQNRSSEPDQVLQPWMPQTKALAAVIGFDIGLRTYEKAKIAVELVVDIEDLDGDRIVLDKDKDTIPAVGRPGTALTPPAAAPRM